MNFTIPEQTGGYSEIHVWALEETSNWPEVVTDLNSKDIIFTPIDATVQGSIDPESIRVEDRPSTTAGGKLHRVRVTFDFTSQSPALELLLEQYEAVPVVVTVTKNYNQKKLYGTNKYPLYMSYTPVDGPRFEDGSLTRIDVGGDLPIRASYVLNPVEIIES